MAPLEVGPPLLQASWAEGRIVVWAGPGRRRHARGPRSCSRPPTRAASHGSAIRRFPSPAGPPRRPVRPRSPRPWAGWSASGAGQAGEPDRSEPALDGRDRPVGHRAGRPGPHGPGPRGATARVAPAAAKAPGRHRVRWVPALLAGAAARPGDPDADRGRGPAAGRPGRMPCADRCWPPWWTPSARAGAARLVAPAPRRTPAPAPRSPRRCCPGCDGRPFVADAEPAGRVGRGPEAVGRARHHQPPGRSDRAARPAPGRTAAGCSRWRRPGWTSTPCRSSTPWWWPRGPSPSRSKPSCAASSGSLPVLRRPSTRRGQVVLDGDEAVELMFTIGPSLTAAGFDAMLPVVSTRRPRPQLRLFTEAVGPVAGRCAAARQRALVGLLRRPRTRRRRASPPWPRKPSRWCRCGAGGCTSTGPISPRPRPPWPNGRRSPSCPARRSSATPSAWRGPRWPDRCGSTAAAGPPTCSGAPRPIRRRPSTPPTASPVSCAAYQAEAAGWLGFLDRAGLGGCLAMDMGLGKTPDPARPSARRPRPRPDAGDLPAGRPQQLGQRGAPLHPGPQGGRAPRAAAGRGRRHRPPGGHLRRGAHHLRHRRARHRAAVRHRLATGRRSTRPRSSRTTRATPPRSCAASPPIPGWP